MMRLDILSSYDVISKALTDNESVNLFSCTMLQEFNVKHP